MPDDDGRGGNAAGIAVCFVLLVYIAVVVGIVSAVWWLVRILYAAVTI